jgi:hypothetical protein
VSHSTIPEHRQTPEDMKEIIHPPYRYPLPVLRPLQPPLPPSLGLTHRHPQSVLGVQLCLLSLARAKLACVQAVVYCTQLPLACPRPTSCEWRQGADLDLVHDDVDEIVRTTCVFAGGGGGGSEMKDVGNTKTPYRNQVRAHLNFLTHLRNSWMVPSAN